MPLDEPPRSASYVEDPSIGNSSSNHTQSTSQSDTSSWAVDLTGVALHMYFENLATEMAIDRMSEQINVVMDNAHIPLRTFGDEGQLSGDDLYNSMEGMSRSLSAIHTVSFPPPFLKETASRLGGGVSRWESMESSSSSDFCLSVPNRSWERPRRCGPPTAAAASRSSLSPALSLDSTEKLLRELPLESPSCGSSHDQHHRNGSNNKSVMRKGNACTSYASQEGDLPSLKGYPFDKIEPHPRVVQLRRISEGSLECKSSFEDDDVDNVQGEQDTESFSPYYEDLFPGTKNDEPSTAKVACIEFDRWNSSPASSLLKDVSSPSSPTKKAKNLWHTVTKGHVLSSSLSPRALSDFPMVSSPLSSTPASKRRSKLALLSDLEKVIEDTSQHCIMGNNAIFNGGCC